MASIMYSSPAVLVEPIPVSLVKNTITCVSVFIGTEYESWCETARPWVTEGEWEYAQRFVHAKDAVRHLVGHALVRRFIAQVLGRSKIDETFASGKWGKLFLPHCPVQFCISHSGDVIQTAFCHEISIGIDVEQINPQINYRDFFSSFHPIEAEELSLLSSDEAIGAFFRCWVRKEAVLKAIGTGLNVPLNRLCVRVDEKKEDWLRYYENFGSCFWTTADILIHPKYSCSVAGISKKLSVSLSLLQ